MKIIHIQFVLQSLIAEEEINEFFDQFESDKTASQDVLFVSRDWNAKTLNIRYTDQEATVQTVRDDDGLPPGWQKSETRLYVLSLFIYLNAADIREAGLFQN